jgi:phospholipase/lecithinase/hemolysin
MANRYTHLAAMYFADSLHPTNYMHRFCHRPLAAHSQKQNRTALVV